tara:strand:+ start:48 stop:461 length:414 start_codon:yes stop_codon:yes gene_type:complete
MNLKPKWYFLLRVTILLLFIMIIFDVFFHNSKYIKVLNVKNLKNIDNISSKNFLFDKNHDKGARYFVQLGIFAKPHEVDKIKARISLLGLNPNIKNYLLNGKLTKKVTLGPYLNYKIFESILRKLEENQIKYLILNE